MIRQRVADGRKAKAAKGGHIGGTRPFGYRVKGKGRDAQLIPIPAEQDAIKKIKRLHKRGNSYRSITGKVTAATGLKISHVTVGRVLSAEKADNQ